MSAEAPAPSSGPDETSLTLWLYLRALGFVYLCAFLSFWAQLEGLIGPEGIWPAQETMEMAKASGRLSVLNFPTWCWLSASPTSLHLQAALGVALSIALLLGIANVPLLILNWSLYLSFASVGRIFMGYQWDNLLLEAGLLAAFIVPATSLFAHRISPSPRLGLWLHRALVFKLMFSSGFVKLKSGDLAWRSFDAMKFHYETQPIPSPLSWFMHQLPPFVHEASVVFVFAVQLGAPVLLFAPRLWRHFGVALLAGLQVLILLTGNYGFFNLLALALLLTGLDDAELARLLPARVRAWLGRRPLAPPARGKLGFAGAVSSWSLGTVLVLLTTVTLADTLGVRPPESGPIAAMLEAAAPLRSVNGYGLFAVMTTQRPEIEIEGSHDGVRFEPYVFRYKTGPLDRNAPFILGHMPRLDWQMWFAALGPAEQSPWFSRFLLALLEGRKPVQGLLERDPFEGRAPRFVRATYWDYRFTNTEERRRSGHYWRRTERGLYFRSVERPASGSRSE